VPRKLDVADEVEGRRELQIHAVPLLPIEWEIDAVSDEQGSQELEALFEAPDLGLVPAQIELHGLERTTTHLAPGRRGVVPSPGRTQVPVKSDLTGTPPGRYPQCDDSELPAQGACEALELERREGDPT